MKFVYGNRDRIFINTALGCKANCKYCYLPDMKNEDKINYISADNAIELVEDNPFFIKGQGGTILSIGCYSESLDENNIMKTKEILEYFLPMGNYIQLATKQEVTEDIINVIINKRTFEEQVSIYISMPTISGISQLENGTASFQVRIGNIARCIDSGISVVLYIKPFLERMTTCDKEKYLQILKKYEVPVIIGNFLSVNNSDRKADVGEKLLFEQKESSLYKEFVSEFEDIGQVFRHSVELVEYYRQRRNDTDDRRVD